MSIGVLIERLNAYQDRDAMIWRAAPHTYASLLEAFVRCRAMVRTASVAPGSVVSLEPDFSPNSVALLLALIDLG